MSFNFKYQWCEAAFALLITFSAAAQQPAPTISLTEALARAQANEPTFAAAAAAAKVAHLDRSTARAALLPQAIYHNQFLYTQGGGLATDRLLVANPTAVGTSTPRFIANNGGPRVHQPRLRHRDARRPSAQRRHPGHHLRRPRAGGA